jgi:hypothetical protein
MELTLRREGENISRRDAEPRRRPKERWATLEPSAWRLWASNTPALFSASPREILCPLLRTGLGAASLVGTHQALGVLDALVGIVAAGKLKTEQDTLR